MVGMMVDIPDNVFDSEVDPINNTADPNNVTGAAMESS